MNKIMSVCLITWLHVSTVFYVRLQVREDNHWLLLNGLWYVEMQTLCFDSRSCTCNSSITTSRHHEIVFVNFLRAGRFSVVTLSFRIFFSFFFSKSVKQFGYLDQVRRFVGPDLDPNFWQKFLTPTGRPFKMAISMFVMNSTIIQRA